MSGEAPASVLLLGEEEPDALSLRETISPEGCQVLEPPEGAAGLQWAEGMELDLVIADLDGPRAANVGLLRGVRRLHPQAVLIVFLPPGGLGEALRELGKLGVYRILSKPWSREELRLTVRLALRCRELLREHTRLQVRAGERLAALREVAAETN